MSEKQALVNREAFENAGLYDPLRHGASADRICEELNCGEAYVTQMLRGDKPLSGKIRSKIDALIAAKGDGQTGISDAVRGATETVEQFEVDLPATDKPVDRGLYVEIDPLIELKHRLRGMIESAVQIHPGSDQMVVDSYAVRAVYGRLRQILPNKEDG